MVISAFPGRRLESHDLAPAVLPRRAPDVEPVVPGSPEGPRVLADSPAPQVDGFSGSRIVAGHRVGVVCS